MSAGRLGEAVADLTAVALAAERLVGERDPELPWGAGPTISAEAWSELETALAAWREGRGAR